MARRRLNGFRRNGNCRHEHDCAASEPQSQDQEAGPACLQREKRKGQVLRRTLETLVLRRRRARTGVRLRGKSLGSGRGSVSLRILSDALPAQSPRSTWGECRGDRPDFGVRANGSSQGRKEGVAALLRFSRQFWTRYRLSLQFLVPRRPLLIQNFGCRRQLLSTFFLASLSLIHISEPTRLGMI